MKKTQAWFAANKIDDVECLVPDMAGVARGKILPAAKFLKSIGGGGLRLPEEIFNLTVTGRYVEEPETTDPASLDMVLAPDLASIRRVPWYDEPTAEVICDCTYLDGTPVDLAPRYVLKRVLDLYAERGWRPVIAPELEFYLVKPNTDPDYPLEPPIGRSGREEAGGQAYGIDAVNEFDPIVEDIYDYCEAQQIDIDTLSHESGAAQLEINFNHGDPLSLADQVLLFKRSVRQAALKHKIYATFMARPHENEPGSSMHIHQSIVDKKSGQNLFATKSGKNAKLLLNHIAGLQRYMGAAMPFLAPNVNSYRRLVPYSDAPTNVHWASDNRTVALRVPSSGAVNRRVENRVSGADSNPYLAIAASLACGYLGMVEGLEPTTPIEGNAYRYAASLPQHLADALSKLNHAKSMKQVLGERFCKGYEEVKLYEMQQYSRVISSWEREFLLLNV